MSAPRIIAICAAAAAALACNRLSSPTAPAAPPAAGSTIVYTAIGASDVTGIGSSSICPLSDCPNGTGYVQDAIRQLRAQGFTVNVNNLGIPTAVIGPDFQTLGQSHGGTIAGNLLIEEMPLVQSNATLISIFAGVNEIDTITTAVDAGDGGSDPNGYMDNEVKAFASDFTKLLAGIRIIAGSPRIVILNVPNVAGLPYRAGASLAEREASQRIANGMTANINALVSSSITVIDLMCDARSYVASNYSSDGLHPNDAGYAWIGAELVRAITSSSYPTPQSSCAAMSLVQ